MEGQEPIRCPSCRHANRPERRYCGKCGSLLGGECAACGTLNHPGEKFCGSCGAPLTGAEPWASLPASPKPLGAPHQRPADALEGERRQLTVFFCDLVGSTELAGRMDPEEWREIAAHYQRTATGAIGRFGGHVAKALGDGLVVYFGYPEAREDDPERAVRAGLATLNAMATLNRRLEAANGITLAVRVGIHTGMVVVGDGGGSGAEVFGETPNIAARVQALAEPDTVIITAATHRLVAGLFIVEEGGAHSLKGVREPVVVYRVLQPSGVRGRLAVAAARGLTPFVGREDERRLLRTRWEHACEGEGQLVLIMGEAGIGKSRLVQQFKEDLGGTPYSWVECTCSPYHQHTPFAPVTDLLQQALAWRGDRPIEEQLEGLERAMAAVGLKPLDAIPLVAPLLGVVLPERYPPLLLSPEQQRRKLITTLLGWVSGLARLQPLVLVFEDLHWVDPSTLELLKLFVAQLATEPLLLLFTARPDFQPPWLLRAHHAQVTLNPLNRHQVREMIALVTVRVVPPEPVVEALVTRTGGVPLFVEELTRAMLEPEGASSPSRDIPATLQDSLMARLDRLGPAKEVAQVGAALGREFSYPLLHAVLPLPEAELHAALGKLADAEVVHVRGFPPESTYLFKHTLMQDAAYTSLLRSRRRELHRAVARALTERFHEVAETQPELVAQHWTAAGEVELAVAAWQQAGNRAHARSAVVEAVAHYTRALDVLGTLPDTPDRAQQGILLQVLLGQALWATKGYASPEAAEAFAKARQLGEQLGETQQLLFVLLGLFALAVTRGELRAAQEIADQMLRIAEREGAPATLVWAHTAQGVTRHSRGDLVAGREHLSRAMTLYKEGDHRWLPADPGVSSLAAAATAAWHVGLADEARRRVRDALDLAQRIKKAYDLAVALVGACGTYALLREPRPVLAHAEALLQLATEQHFPIWLSWACIYRGWVLAGQGRPDEGIAQLRHALADYLATGQRIGHGIYLGLLAEAYVNAGAIAEGLAAAEDALGAVPEEELYVPELLRLRGDLLARLGTTASQVEASYRDAIALARRMGARSYELRATTSLARLLQSQVRTVEARDFLAPLYATFTEGFDTRDLREAKALLDELA